MSGIDKTNYKPLPFGLFIGKSNIHGFGLISEVRIEKGTYLGITHIEGNPNLFTQGMIRTPLGGFINNSSNPNCKLKDDGIYSELWTIKKINPKEELTLDYTDNKCGIQYIDTLNI